MIVRFRVNLGSTDASALKLDFQECQQGMELEVSDEAGQWLITKGISEQVSEINGMSKAAALQGVPPETPKSKKVKHVAV